MEQIKLVASFDWLDLSALHGVEEEFQAILEGSLFVDAARRDALCQALRQRVDMLDDIVRSRSTRVPGARIDDRSADVTEDVAYSGASIVDVGKAER